MYNFLENRVLRYSRHATPGVALVYLCTSAVTNRYTRWRDWFRWLTRGATYFLSATPQ